MDPLESDIIRHIVMGVNDYCRFCSEPLRIAGQIAHSKNIFEEKGKDKTIFERLQGLDLTLTKRRDMSFRSCQKCNTKVNQFVSALPHFRRWEQAERVSSDPAACSHGSDPALSSGPPSPSPTPSSYDSSSSDKRSRVVTPTKTPRTLKKNRPTPPSPDRHASPTEKRSITEVVMKFPSKTVTKVSQPEEAGIVTNITNQKWKTAAKYILKHNELAEEVKEQILHLIDIECKALCKHDNGCMLLKTAAGDLEVFSFENLESDLKRLSPFLLSILSTVTNGSRPVTCAAAAIAVRGRENRMSAFSYHINSILQHGGAKKAVFESLSKMAITTSHSCAIGKRKEFANTCGETGDAVQALKLEDLEDLDLEEHQKEHGSDVEMSLITQCHFENK